MKYVVFLGDGMSDYPIPALGGRTPLEVARHPAMDSIACRGMLGLTRTIPNGLPAGSDVANMAVLGYDPSRFYSGRSPFEAISMGIDLCPGDVSYRCNLVELSREEDIMQARMIDYSSGEIDSASARKIIEYLAERLERPGVELYPGISYRHCLVLRNAASGAELTPPHDISNQPVKEYFPRGANNVLLNEMTRFAYQNLEELPEVCARREKGLSAPNALWFWGEGRKPNLPSFFDRFGLRGAMISAVDLLHGIALCAGMQSVHVENVTGNYHTDFAAKGYAAIKAFKSGIDYVYIHVEAPDECGHHGEIQEKIYSIEQIDEKIVAPVMAYLDGDGNDYTVLLMPDHPTPISTMTHAKDPVPFSLIRKTDPVCRNARFTESNASQTGCFVEEAFRLTEMMIGIKTNA